MDSARLTKSSASFRRSVETSVSGNGTGSQLTSLFSSFLDNREAQETNTEGQASMPPNVDSGNALTDEMARLGSSTKTRIYHVPKRSDASTEFAKLHQLVIENILKLLFGQRAKDISQETCEESGNTNIPAENYVLVSSTEYNATFYEESEFTSFQANGSIRTDDGRTIDININLEMSRRFVSCHSEAVTQMSYQLVDPLVMNLSDAPAGLSDMTFFFDLDADGSEEEVSMLSGNSGFLALDKNSDGKINDGSELFGTTSGDGFYDLSKYDEDNNGWIDENDSIFNDLRIWTKDADGNDILYTLKQQDIGAICLQNAETDFSLNSKLTNETNGFVRKTGIFLYESGTVGTVQHIDLVS